MHLKSYKSRYWPSLQLQILFLLSIHWNSIYTWACRTYFCWIIFTFFPVQSSHSTTAFDSTSTKMALVHSYAFSILVLFSLYLVHHTELVFANVASDIATNEENDSGETLSLTSVPNTAGKMDWPGTEEFSLIKTIRPPQCIGSLGICGHGHFQCCSGLYCTKKFRCRRRCSRISCRKGVKCCRGYSCSEHKKCVNVCSKKRCEHGGLPCCSEYSCTEVFGRGLRCIRNCMRRGYCGHGGLRCCDGFTCGKDGDCRKIKG